MPRVTPDERTLTELASIRDRAEICDSQGSVVGYSQPVRKLPSADLYVPNVTTEELERYEQEPGGRTRAEIIADFDKRS